MQYVMVVHVPDEYLDDDSIENAARLVNDHLREAAGDRHNAITVRPLSEVIAS